MLLLPVFALLLTPVESNNPTTDPPVTVSSTPGDSREDKSNATRYINIAYSHRDGADNHTGDVLDATPTKIRIVDLNITANCDGAELKLFRVEKDGRTVVSRAEKCEGTKDKECKKDPTLQIKGFHAGDAGKYKVELTCKKGTEIIHRTFTIWDAIVVVPHNDRKSIVKYPGDDADMECEAYGYPAPDFVWKKDGIEVENQTCHNDNKTCITVYLLPPNPTGSRHYTKLKIENLEVSDRGHYECIANNTNKSTSSTTIFLRVKDTGRWAVPTILLAVQFVALLALQKFVFARENKRSKKVNAKDDNATGDAVEKAVMDRSDPPLGKTVLRDGVLTTSL